MPESQIITIAPDDPRVFTQVVELALNTWVY